MTESDSLNRFSNKKENNRKVLNDFRLDKAISIEKN